MNLHNSYVKSQGWKWLAPMDIGKLADHACIQFNFRQLVQGWFCPPIDMGLISDNPALGFFFKAKRASKKMAQKKPRKMRGFFIELPSLIDLCR